VGLCELCHMMMMEVMKKMMIDDGDGGG
jgi:hypothetical protein